MNGGFLTDDDTERYAHAAQVLLFALTARTRISSVWALSGHSLQIERMTGLAQNLNLSRRSKGRGLRNTILTQLTLASNVGVEIYWGIHFHSCTNLELNRDANFVGPYFTIIS